MSMLGLAVLEVAMLLDVPLPHCPSMLAAPLLTEALSLDPMHFIHGQAACSADEQAGGRAGESTHEAIASCRDQLLYVGTNLY